MEHCQYCGVMIKKGNLSKHKQEAHGNLVLDGAIKIAEIISTKAVDKLVERSNILIVQGDPESAIFVLSQVLDAYPNNMEARKTLALALTKLGKYDEAKKVFDEEQYEDSIIL